MHLKQTFYVTFPLGNNSEKVPTNVNCDGHIPTHIENLNGYIVFCSKTLFSEGTLWSQKGEHGIHFRGDGRSNLRVRNIFVRFVTCRQGYLPESQLAGSKEGLYQSGVNSCLSRTNLTQKHRFGPFQQLDNVFFRLPSATTQSKVQNTLCSTSSSSTCLLSFEELPISTS